MAQTLPHPRPSAPQEQRLHWVPGRRSPVDPRRRRLLHGLTLIGLIGGAALGYLCLLVRISAVDVGCHRLETRCEELRTVIASDMTELSSLSDTATNLDRAQANGLCPPEGEDQIGVSPELCRPAAVEAGSNGEAASGPGAAMAAGMGAY